MWIGRDSELLRLRQTILERRSLLICGKPGSGKTSLLARSLLSLPGEIRRKCICCEVRGTLHVLLQQLALKFAMAGDELILSRVQRERGTAASPELWAGSQTSLRLRGVLRAAARSGNYSIFLDAAARVPDGIYRLLQHWMWTGQTPAVVLARGADERELGRASRLFWHEGLCMELGPLGTAAAKELFAACVARFELHRFATPEFCGFVLEESAGLPGAILLLCEMAAHAGYHFGGKIKIHTLRTDFRMKQNLIQPPALRAANHG